MARTPQSGAVRIMRGPAAPDVIPSPSDPMSCSRKSLNGWKVWLARMLFKLDVMGTPPLVGGTKAAGFAAVVMLSTWQPPHPI